MSEFENNIKKYILEYLENKLDENDFQDLSNNGDIDLMATGILSSLEFITLISDIESSFSIEIDFDNYDPSSFNTFLGLVNVASTAKRV
ncbi:MAG: hypothetical protein OEY89_00105 [Gammaproteobacteria bacterium]|nr:hypothetical protein [Gammaproteobacteria bacterium]